MTDSEYGAQSIARTLVADGVDTMFGILGSMDLVCAEAAQLGVTNYVMRHEQAAGFAADAYARCLRKPGLVFTSTAGGMANVVPGIYHAQGTRSPVVLMTGGNAPVVDGLGSGQESHGAELLKSICKWTHRVTEPATVGFWTRRAIRESIQSPPGPITLEFAGSAMKARDTSEQVKYLRTGTVPPNPMSAGDPALVAQLLERLLAAERPILIAGDGVHWSDASADLVEFAELMALPTCSRRTARGAMPEQHPLSFMPSLRRGFVAEADLILILGHQITGMDEWFESPPWPRRAKYLQVQETAADVWPALDTEVAVVGSSKPVLRQLIELARSLLAAPPRHVDWLAALDTAKQRNAARSAAGLPKLREGDVIHPKVLCAEIAAVLDESSTLIYDSFTASQFMTGQMTASYDGQILDAGMFQTLGHSIGMAVGAQVARPGRQVLSLIGDGGFGIAGIDLETMARYDLPAVVVLFNNSPWGGRGWAHNHYLPALDASMTKDLRYDLMFEQAGCHGEFVTKSADIRPALERAFASGRPSVVNVIGDVDSLVPVRARANLLELWARGTLDGLSPEALAEVKTWRRPEFERAAKRSRDHLFGRGITVEQLADFVGVDLDPASGPGADG